MDKLIIWWEGLDTREQLVVAMGGLIMALGAFVFLALLPLLNWQDQEQLRLQQTIDEANEVRQLAARIQLKKQTQGNTKPNEGLSVLVDNSLRENELIMRGFQPGRNNDARLRLENAAYPSLAQWLFDLEYRHGVTILDLSLTPAKTSGRLMVSVRLSK